MADHPALDAGNFKAWLERQQNSAGPTDNDVPCGECNACCRAAYFIHLTPSDNEARRQIPSQLLFPAPGLPAGHQVMGFDERGCCPMLRSGSCTIYAQRPQTCRDYDCRIFAATGINPGDEAKAEVHQRVEAWAFSYTNDGERRTHDTLRRIARLLQSRNNDPRVPGNATQLALLAISLHAKITTNGADKSALEQSVERALADSSR